MTSSGRRVAFFMGVLIAFGLPKRVDCGYPAGICAHTVRREQCTAYEIEPWLFYGLEYVLKRDIGFAYKSGEDCR